jgi:hypothetical protein
LAYGGMILFNEQDKLSIEYKFPINYKPLVDGFGIDNSMIIYRRTAYDKIPVHFSNRACDFILASLISNFSPLSGCNFPVSIYKKNTINRSSSLTIKNIKPKDYSLYFSGVDYAVDFDPYTGYAQNGILIKA